MAVGVSLRLCSVLFLLGLFKTEGSLLEVDPHGKLLSSSSRSVLYHSDDGEEQISHAGEYLSNNIFLEHATTVKEVVCGGTAGVEHGLHVHFYTTGATWNPGDNLILQYPLCSFITTHVFQITSITYSTTHHAHILGKSLPNLSAFDHLNITYSSTPPTPGSLKKRAVNLGSFSFNTKDGKTAINKAMTLWREVKQVNGVEQVSSVTCTKCYATASMGVTVSITYKSNAVETFSCQLNGNVLVNMDVEANVNAICKAGNVFNLMKATKIDIDHMTLTTSPPIELEFTPTLSLDAKLYLVSEGNFKTVTGFDYTYDVNFGWKYAKKDGWTSIRTGSAQYKKHPISVSTSPKTNFDLTLIPTIAVTSLMDDNYKFNWGLEMRPSLGLDSQVTACPSYYQYSWRLDAVLRASYFRSPSYVVLTEPKEETRQIVVQEPLRCEGCYGCVSQRRSIEEFTALVAIGENTEESEGEQSIPWICNSALAPFPFRINSQGDVECFSLNGRTCNSSITCPQTLTIPTTLIKPLACGAKHECVYGQTGYNDPKSWCSIIRNFKTSWVCIPGINTLVRMFNGEVQCLSSGSGVCVWDSAMCSDGYSDTTLLTLSRYRPFSCGDEHKSVWGVTGFEDPNHWCSRTLSAYTPYTLVSLDRPPVRYLKGDIQCLSWNGKDCTLGEEGYYPTARPLSCGEVHKSLYGSTGYEYSWHWCHMGLKELAPWYCVENVSIPVRYFLGDIQCLSFDGMNCRWGDSPDCTSRPLVFLNSTTLSCGEQHQKVWGVTGYEDPKHWCRRGLEALLPWYSIPSISPSPLRIFQGNAQCLSPNGKNCYGFDGCIVPFTSVPNSYPLALQLTCGADHLAKWGSTGYDTPRHWCPKALNALSPWSCIPGLFNTVRYYKGDIQCLSFNGATCIGPCNASTTIYPTAVPLTCGDAHKAIYGVTGYDDPSHWCSIALAALGKWTCVPGTSFAVQYFQGNVRCLSSNGINCQSLCPSDNPVLGGTIKPLVCGAAHAAIYTTTGYDDPTHWCSIALSYFKLNGIAMKEEEQITPLLAAGKAISSSVTGMVVVGAITLTLLLAVVGIGFKGTTFKDSLTDQLVDHTPSSPALRITTEPTQQSVIMTEANEEEIDQRYLTLIEKY